MADASAKVQTVFSVDNQASAGLNTIARDASLTSKALGGATASLRSVGQAMASIGAAVGVGFGVSSLVSFAKGAVSANAALEETTVGMAGLLYQSQKMGYLSGFGSFSDAAKNSSEIMSDLEKYASKAIGTTENYVDAWKAVSLPILKAGGDLGNVMEIAKLLVPTATQFGIGMDTAGFSIKQALMGMVDGRDMFISLLGLESDEINALAKKDPAAVLRKISEAMGNGAEGAKAFGDTFAAQMASAEDAWLKLKRQIGLPLFREVSKQLRDVLEWSEKNKAAIDEFAKTVGVKLKDAFIGIVDAGKWIYDHWAEIKRVVVELAEVWIAVKLMSGMQALVKLAVTFRNAMLTAQAVGIAGGVAGGAAAAGTAARMTAGESALAVGAAGYLASLKAGLKAGIPVAGEGAIGVGTGIGVGRAGIGVMGGNAARLAAYAPNAAGGPVGIGYAAATMLMSEEDKYALSLDGLMKPTLDKMSSIFAPMMTQLPRAVDESLLPALETAAEFLGESSLYLAHEALEPMRDVLQTLNIEGEALLDMMQIQQRALIEMTQESSVMADFLRAITPGLREAAEKATPAKKEEKDKKGNHFYNPRIEIKIDAKHNDPDRVAKSLFNTLGREAVNRTMPMASWGGRGTE